MTEKTFTMDNFDVVCVNENYSWLAFALNKALEELCKVSAESGGSPYYGVGLSVMGKTMKTTMDIGFSVDNYKLAMVRIKLLTDCEDLVTHLELAPDDHYIGIDSDGCGYTFFVDRLAEALKDTFTMDWL